MTVLYVYGDKLRHGGIENFMMNYFRNIDRKIVQIDFAVQGEEPGAFEDEILEAGSHIYRLPKPGNNPFRFATELKKILQTQKYPIVHSHCDAMNYRVLKIAKKCNVPVRISHSHNTEHVLPQNSVFKMLFYEYCRKHIVKYASVCYACSQEAGKWMYGCAPFTVVPNAIDLNSFLFSGQIRESLRNRYKINKDTIVLGNVGRFDTQKNQLFLVRLLRELLKNEPEKYILMLIGEGWMRKKIESLIESYHLENYVIFTGEIQNVHEYYNMMDIFVMPSYFEGYGIALEEAEVNGLPCIASQFVPKEVSVLNQINYLPLDVKLWAQKAKQLNSMERNTGAAECFRARGYDIKDAAKWLQNEYVRLGLKEKKVV